MRKTLIYPAQFGRLLATALMCTGLWAMTATAQTEEDALRFSQRNPATGARMTGMAGAGIAGIADWSAVFSNPAGLGWLKNSELVGSLNNLSATSDATFRVPGFSSFTDANATRTRLSNIGYVYKAPTVRGSLAFGVGFNQTNTFERSLLFAGENANNSITDFFLPLPDEFAIDEQAGDDGVFGTDDDVLNVDFFRDLSFFAYETFAIDLDFGLLDSGEEVPFVPAVSAGTVEQTGDVIEEGGVSELSFGGAVEAAEGVMVGGSANFTFGSYRFERLFEEFDINDENEFNSLSFRQGLETDLVGVNARAGVSAQVAPMLRAGLTIETPTYYALDESFTTRLETEFDTPDADGNFTYAITDGPIAGAEYRVVTPWRLGGGLALTVADLTLAADAELVDWTQMRLRPGDDAVDVDDDLYFDDVNRVIRQTFTSVVNARVGGEYNLGPVALRAGYAIQPSPYGDDESELDRTRTFTSLGLGFNAGQQLQVNLGYVREQFDDRYVPYSEVVDAPVVIEDVKRDRVTLGLRFFF